MINNFSRSVCICAFTVLILSACVTGSSGGRALQSYPYACDTAEAPFEPFCLGIASYDNKFTSSRQFDACKADMQAFENAINEHSRCSRTKLKFFFDELMKEVPATYNCYVEYFSNKDKGDPSSQCPPVNVDRFRRNISVDGLETYAGVPRCVSKIIGFNFAPKSKYQLYDCREEVDAFVGKNASGYTSNASSAQKQYDTYIRNLDSLLKIRLDDAVRKFNCYANEEKYCL